MRRRVFLFICVIFFLCGYVFPQNDARITIAVNDLKGSGIVQSTAVIISDRLRAELVNTGVFRVMERAEMETILKEQGFQQTGACDSSASCLVKVGQLLGVQRMVAGSVGRVENFWTMSLRMLDVATSEILFNISEDFQGEVKDVISKVTAKAAAKVASKEGASLSIKVQPANAEITINGKPIAGRSMDSMMVPAGEIEILAWASGYDVFRQSHILSKGEKKDIDIRLASVFGSLKVASNPAGAAVYINEKRVGATPYESAKLMQDKYLLRLELPGYESVTEYLLILREQTTEKHYEFKRTKAFLDSIDAYNLSKYRKGRWVRRITFGVLAAGCGAAGAFFNNRSTALYNDYMADKGYDTGRHDADWQSVKNAETIRNVCYLFTGVCAAAFVVSIQF